MFIFIYVILMAFSNSQYNVIEFLYQFSKAYINKHI